MLIPLKRGVGKIVDFSVRKRKHSSEHSYKKDNLDIAYLFAKKCHEECKDLVKAIVLFGSTARKKQGANDVDVLVLIDDVELELSPELIQSYRVILGNIIKGISTRLHITTLKLTAFWEYVRVGDPIAINILRDGFPLLDTGFFDPLQLLLHQGRIKPSTESIQTYLSRGKQTLQNSEWHVMQATVDLYWAVIDSAHAALMHIGVVPPSPEHVAELLQDRLVKTKLIPEDIPNLMNKFYTLSKDILHKKRTHLSGADFDDLFKEATYFVDTMSAFIKK